MNQIHEKTFCRMSKLRKTEFIYDRIQLSEGFDEGQKLDRL